MSKGVVLKLLKNSLDMGKCDSIVKYGIQEAIRELEGNHEYFQIQEKIISSDIIFEEFDFNKLIKSDNYETVTGLKVTIDKILKDVTGTTVLGIGGTLVVRGIRLRIVWDPMGNVLEYKRIARILSPFRAFTLQNIFEGATSDMFRLVNVQRIEKSKED